MNFRAVNLFSVLILIGYGISYSQVPDGYEIIHQYDFETTQKSGEYLGKNFLYFYSNVDNVTNNTDPEIYKRFIITGDPDGGSNNVLKMIKFADDWPGHKNPRTELSGQPSMRESASKEIYFHLRTYFPTAQKDIFSAEFIQFWLHAPDFNIPLQIEARNGYFGARDPRHAGILPFPDNIKLNDNLGRWITWEVYGKFNKNDGYWRIYMDGKHVFTWNHSSTEQLWPNDNETWHPQFGIYSNSGNGTHMEAYFDDLIIAQFTGQYSSPEINLLSPMESDTFTAPASIEITADAQDPSGATISMVEIFNRDTLLARLTSEPYTWIWENPAEGTHRISAKATNASGKSSYSDSVNIFVNSPPRDCNGDIHGNAYYDDCGICVGGTTGLLPNDNCNTECSNEIKVYASDDDGNIAENTLDDNYETRWSTDKSGAEIIYSLPCPVMLEKTELAFYRGDQRSTLFDIAVSADSTEWSLLFNGQSSGSTLEKEVFETKSQNAIRFIRIRGYGNSLTGWTSITQASFDYTLVADCNGVKGGTSVLNECDECVDNRMNSPLDCFTTGIQRVADELQDALHNFSKVNNVVSFTLNRKSAVKFVARTLNGRVVKSLSRTFDTGIHRLPLKEYIATPGVYICRILINGEKERVFKTVIE